MKKAIVVCAAVLALTLAGQQKASAGGFSFSCGFNFSISLNCGSCCNPCCPPCWTGLPALGPSCPDCFGGPGGFVVGVPAAGAWGEPAGLPAPERLPVGPKPASYLQPVNYSGNPYAGYYQNAGYYGGSYGGYGSQAAPAYWYGY